MKGKVIEENLVIKEQNLELESDTGNRKRSESSSAIIETETVDQIGGKDKGDRRVSFDLRSDVVEEPEPAVSQAGQDDGDDHKLIMTDVFPVRDHQESNQR
jgi:hypothetical protein